MSSIAIRPLIEDDIAPMAAWMVKYPLWSRYGLTEERACKIMRQGLTDRDILLTADTDESNACGFAYVLPRGAFGLSPYLRWLAVRQDMTGSGVGLALLKAAEQESIAYRSELFLLAADFNTGAHRFYERSGYTRVGEIPDYVVSGVTELIYWKRLHVKGGVS